MSIWRYYSKVHRENMQKYYLDDAAKDHLVSVHIRFTLLYGAKDFDDKSLQQGNKGAGQIRREDIYGLWKRECVELSGFCKTSTPRARQFTPTPCGACREVVRDLMIAVRRKADTPRKAKIGLVEDLFADTCAKVPQWHAPERAKPMQKVCEDTLQDEYGDEISIAVHRALQQGTDNWAELGGSDTFTDKMQQHICTEDRVSCDWGGK